MSGAITVCGSLSRYPVSLGRAMHDAGYAALGLDWVYVPFACVDARAALDAVRALSIRGVGVSMPFKLEVIPHLDALDPLAARIGAVNTIVNDGGRLTGHNTDASGALRALEEVTAVGGRRVLLLGAGGAARAVAHALATAGAELVIANRDEAKARDLAGHVGAVGRGEGELARAADYEIVVNATSVGMTDTGAASPLADGALRAGQIVMDIVYKPLRTALLDAAARAGATTIDGSRMLLFQAMEQFRLYTAHDPPREAMERALLAAIGDRPALTTAS